MSYESVLEQVKTAPEACLDEISNIIGYVVYRYNQQNSKLEEELLSDRREIRSQIENGTLQTYSNMAEYRNAYAL